MCRAGMSALIEEADSEEEEVWMVGGSPCNELLLWPSSTPQQRWAGMYI